MRALRVLLFAAALCGCESTPKAPEAGPDGDITISNDELAPMRRFVLETRRVIAAQFIRVEATRQFFEQAMGFTRDPVYVRREGPTLMEDGTRLIILRNDLEQEENLDPDLLPRVYFGMNGLELRAYKEIRIYLVEPKDRERPIHLTVQARNAVGDVKMWVTGRLQHAKPSLTIVSQLIWSPEKKEYKHRSSIG